MALTPIGEIKLAEDRQRKVFNDTALEELAQDIDANGLLHPLVVAEVNNGLQLVAGERRYRAIKMLFAKGKFLKHNGQVIPPGMVPVVKLGGEGARTELEMVEAELSENIMRQDLTWQERTAAAAKLHKLRVMQNPSQTVTATAQEIARKQGRDEATRQETRGITRATIIADFLDDPEVQLAQSEHAAFRIVSQKLSEQFAAALETPSIDAIISPQQHELYHGKFQQVIDAHPEWEKKFACVLTDPPYGIGVEGFGSAAALRHTYDESDTLRMHEQLADRIGWACTDDAHVYVFCDIAMFTELCGIFERRGWRVRRTPLVWYKGPQGHITEGITGFRRSYELIFVASRGERAYTALVMDTLLQHSAVAVKQFAAEKPVGLYEQLLKQSTDAGEWVLDPFAGSGTIFPAATQLDLRAVGIEADEQTVTLIEGYREIKRVKEGEQSP